VALSEWIDELRQRGVLRALLAYGVVVFAVLQVIEPVLHGLRLPDTSLSYVVVGLGMGFPLVAGLAWMFERRRKPASPGAYLARRQRRRLLAVGSGAVLLALVVTGAVQFAQRAPRGPFSGAPSIVVLPFVNLGGDADQDYFADGLTEEIQGALSQIPGLRVIGRTTSFALRGKSADLREVARGLGVTSILEGSVRRSGSRLRVSAQIVDAREGFQLWSQTFDREAGDVLAVQDEIGRAVSKALEVKLLPASKAGGIVRPIDPEVYNQYLLARRFLAPSNLDGFVRAAAASEKAIELAPGFAPAWATLASASSGIADYVEAPDEIEANQRKAISAAAHAIELDPRLAEAYAIRAQLLAQTTWDWEAAGEDLDRALALAPGDADILRKKGAWLLAPQGRLSEAIDLLRRSTELDPLSASGWTSLGVLQVAAGQGEDGERSLHRATEIDPENDYARQGLGIRQLLAGRPAAALAETSRCSPGLWRLRGAALAEHDLGNAREAKGALAELTAQFAFPSPYQIAEVHAWRGESDQAFAWLEKAMAARDGGLLLLQWDPLLARIRGDPRMAALQRRMNLNPG
jgi:TolB-like protein/tetratricopeptide (TPR) repeat protein